MKEITAADLEQRLQTDDGKYGIYFYTPLCGTCKLAEQMLEVILTMKPEMELYKGNINFMPGLAKQWEIRSVPCIMLIHERKPIQAIYAMNSVDHLYRILNAML